MSLLLPAMVALLASSHLAAAQAPVAPNREQAREVRRNISGLIAPCAVRAKPPNAAARSIAVDLRVALDRNGVPTSHQLIRATGVNEKNSAYVDAVVALAMRTLRACSARIATLPAHAYGGPSGWQTLNYRFSFP
jgi:hypothetical protein